MSLLSEITRRLAPADTFDPDTRMAEIVGRVSFTAVSPWRHRTTLSVDTTQPDYSFWDLFRRGMAEGYKLAGQFAQPIAEIIASFVLGSGVQAQLADTKDLDPANEADPRVYTNSLLAAFMTRMRGSLLEMVQDDYTLGDQYIIVNPDSSISIPSPEMVDFQYDKLDYRKPVKATITTKLPEATVTDEYRLDGRTVTIRWNKGGQAPQVFEYQNLIGKLPVIHFPNDRSANETKGRPIYESLLPVFSEYDDVLMNGLDATKITGKQVPTIEGLKDPEHIEVLDDDNSDEEIYTDKDGKTKTRKEIRWDRNPTVILGEGGSFKFTAPAAGFTADIVKMLETLFYLVMDRTRIAEYMWGGAIASSKASAETQTAPFEQFIEGRRLKLAGEGADQLLGVPARCGLHELLEVWLLVRKLIDPRVVVAPVTLAFPKISQEDKALLLDWFKALGDRNAITDETFLAHAPAEIDDPKKELEAARKEADDKQAAFEDQTQKRIDLEAQRGDPAANPQIGKKAA